MTTKAMRTPYQPIDGREPATVRAVILARKSGAGVADDVQSQVQQCEAFIRVRGWQLIADPYAYAETGKSGYRDVERPVLDAVLKLAQRRAVDVIVAREFERVARTKLRRHYAMYTVEHFGAEFRFANMPPTGKLSDDQKDRLYLALADEFGQMERDRIVERTGPGLARRAASGIPGHGRGGARYGYTWSTNIKTTKGKNAAYEIDPADAQIVRDLFTRADTDDQFTYRRMADELERSVPTPTGIGRWHSTTVKAILTNPIYCGRGYRGRYRTEWQRTQHPETGEVYETRIVHNRTRTPDDFTGESTYALDAARVPAIVDATLFDRVQRKLAARKPFTGRTDRVTTRAADATLLNGGLVRCAHCHNALARHWRSKHQGQLSEIPYYQCPTGASIPSHSCTRHAIPAPEVDALALRLLAKALTEPEHVLKIADMAEQQRARAVDAAELTSAQHAARHSQLMKIEADQARYRRMLAACDVQEDAVLIDDLRAKLGKLDDEREQVERDLAQVVPQQARALHRQALLERLTVYSLGPDWSIDLKTGQVTGLESRGEPNLTPTLDLGTAARLLGVSAEKIAASNLATVISWPEGAEDEEWHSELAVETPTLVELLLRRTSRDQVRKLLRDLNVTVWVSRPLPRAQWTSPKGTRVKERVQLEILADPENGAAGLMLCADVANNSLLT
jgi:site-specific DNA recombinase